MNEGKAPSKVQYFLIRGTRVNLTTSRRKESSRPPLSEVVEQPDNCKAMAASCSDGRRENRPIMLKLPALVLLANYQVLLRIVYLSVSITFVT